MALTVVMTDGGAVRAGDVAVVAGGVVLDFPQDRVGEKDVGPFSRDEPDHIAPAVSLQADHSICPNDDTARAIVD